MKVFKAILAILFCIVIALLALDYFFPPNTHKMRDLSRVVYDKNENIISITLSKDEKWRIGCENCAPKKYIDILKFYEDRYYEYHFGVNPLSMVRAAKQMFECRKIISGGSTITMQTARLLHGRRRSLVGKITECLRAVQLEVHFSKKQIMDMYLTLAPYGHNIEGLAAASLFYYKKKSSDLLLEEMLSLVTMPQAPRAKDGRQKIAYANIVRHLSDAGIIKNKERVLKNWPGPLRKKSVPTLAPHMLQSFAKTSLYSFLDANLQASVINILQQHAKEADTTAAAIVMRLSDGAIVGYVGSAFWGDKKSNGFVDMANSMRSPGSTLKPFIYAMGFHEGIIHPNSVIKDAKTNFAGYSPKNFSGEYMGPVRVWDALRFSLNTPAVMVLSKIGASKFIATLQSAGITVTSDASLPSALGGVGITLLDLVTLYSSLPRDGEIIMPLIDKKSPTRTKRLFGKKAASYVNNILCTAVAPMNTMDHGDVQHPYKTGTSYGHRDAWAVGYTKNYVVGVWVGRSDGRPAFKICGYETTAPLLFRIIQLLRDEKYTPRSVDILRTDTLPDKLKEFCPRKGVSLIFPNDGAKIAATAGTQLIFSAAGNALPFKWFINGVPIDWDARCHYEKTLSWTVPGAGEYRITVMDADRKTSSALVAIE